LENILAEMGVHKVDTLSDVLKRSGLEGVGAASMVAFGLKREIK
jgi:hypothetical protein